MHSRRRSEPFTKRDPIRDAVAGRAYEIFLERGGQHGNDLDDWLQAEREMLGVVSQRKRESQSGAELVERSGSS
jgi:hypothetical protein